MTEEIVKQLVVPATGEVIDLTGTPADLASKSVALKDLQGQLGEVRAAISKELLARMTRNNQYEIVDAGDYTISGDPPGPAKKWQDEESIQRLQQVLVDLQLEGIISAQAADDAITSEIKYTVQSTKMRSLRRISPEVEALIDDAVVTEPKTQYVRIKPRKRLQRGDS